MCKAVIHNDRHNKGVQTTCQWTVHEKGKKVTEGGHENKQMKYSFSGKQLL